MWAKSKQVFIDQFLLICYAVAALIALTWPTPGKAVLSLDFSVNGRHYQVIKTLNIMIVFLVSGLMLKTDDIKKAMRYKLGVAFGFISTLAITPCLGFAFREIPLTPSAYTAGLTLTAAVPQTLGIGISLVRSCGGNEGLALMLTVGTNIIGIFTMPLWLKALFSGTDFDLSIDMVALLVNLLLSVFVPSVIGKAVRDLCGPVRRFVTRYKVPLELFSTANLAFIVWQVLSGAQSILIDQPFVGLVYVVLLSAGQHIVYMINNFLVSTYALRMPPPENVSTGVMASQKSGPVSVAVISYITNDTALQGLLAIPAVIGQLVQVFIGSALVPFFARYTARYRAAQKIAAEEAARGAAAAGLEGGDAADAGGPTAADAAAKAALAGAEVAVTESTSDLKENAKLSSGLSSSQSAPTSSSESDEGAAAGHPHKA
ncbi:BASS family transporter: sodium ion bile [Micractinium conductrix]|uniref:BASS family transporter: sodium ion bile n=1 Tax=Micractinium conductrix TaxID=554055 RepID=A0A2P6VRQ9_9CHLO|nr:BASS family transporter: sodium ion bile [Micractinium conductrix]|eukprot:PSC76757.1 BASS family transporter: sodium ion bile [Micractinium conductrix]